MDERSSAWLRVVVPVGLALVALLVAWAVFRNSTAPRPGPVPSTPAPAPATTPAPAAPAPGTPTAPSAAPDVTPQAPPGPTESPAGVPEGLLQALRVELVDPDAPPYATLGSTDPASGFAQEIVFSPTGAGIESLRLAGYEQSVRKPSPRVEVQGTRRTSVRLPGATPDAPPRVENREVVPMSALGLFVRAGRGEGAFIPLVGVDPATGLPARAWRELAPGLFEAHIVNGAGQRVLRVERAYALTPNAYDVRVAQRVINLTGVPVDVRWVQFGPVDLDADAATYGGDKRRVRFGYLLPPEYDPTRAAVLARDFLWTRSSALGSRTDAGAYPPSREVWPNDRSREQRYSLVWAGMTNRYFAAAVHPHAAPSPGGPAPAPDMSFRAVEQVDRVLLNEADPQSPMVLRLTSGWTGLGPGAGADFSQGLYAGPQSRRAIAAEPAARAAGVQEIVIHNFGGPCAPCTFPFLTHALLWLLHTLHDTLLHDWALAIVLLVVVVRSLLHPVNRWAQVRMMRFGKQMQAVGPKAKIIQEKYKDDRQKLTQEMQKLWREEGISPAGLLGCLPMFMQMPVWIALYATLYFAVELRQEPAFFGVFQTLTSGRWYFLADLAEPDHAVWFSRAFHIPLLSDLMGPISGLNVLPLVLGVVFFVHQKFLTPPTSVPLSPEQEQQQKMIRVISVVLFPLVMYNAPSGLAIYFITNSTIAIFENKWVRAHAEKKGLLDVKPRPAGSGGGGFLANLQRLAEERQKRLAQQAKTRSVYRNPGPDAGASKPGPNPGPKNGPKNGKGPRARG